MLELLEVSKKCNSQLFVEKIVPIINSAIIKDTSEHVRSSLSRVICGIGQNLGKELAEKNILQICIQMTKDDNIDVRLCLLQTIHSIIEVMTPVQLDTHVIPLYLTVAGDKQWRIRLEIVKLLPDLAKKLNVDLFKDKLMNLFMGFLVDNAFQIREEATKNIVRLGDIFGKQWMEDQIILKINEFKAHANYLFRINTLFIISKLKEFLDPLFINSNLISIAVSLKGDIVPNIRFNVAKCLDLLAPVMTEENIKKEVIPCLQQLMNDQDIDVKYFAEKALKNEKILTFI